MLLKFLYTCIYGNCIYTKFAFSPDLVRSGVVNDILSVETMLETSKDFLLWGPLANQGKPGRWPLT